MRCYFEDCKLKVVTRGGSELINNVRHKISSIYPLEDGIIIKTKYNADLYSFELGGGVSLIGHGKKTMNTKK